MVTAVAFAFVLFVSSAAGNEDSRQICDEVESQLEGRQALLQVGRRFSSRAQVQTCASGIGQVATLDEAGYNSVRHEDCAEEMFIFVRRVIEGGKVCDYSQEACRRYAQAQGLQLGGAGADFAGDYTTKGCYTYASGPFAGRAYYGLVNGADVTSEGQLGALSSPQQRVSTCAGPICVEGALAGLVPFYDCDDDHMSYDDLLAALAAAADPNSKCPWIGAPDCLPFDTEICGSFPGATLPPCKYTREPSTTTTTSITTTCTDITNWDAKVFASCDFWGDPHWKATFFAGRYPNEYGRRWDFYGNGIFEVASTNDGSFKMQSFQCRVENGKAAVAVSLAMQIDGKSYFIYDGKAEIDGVLQTNSNQLLTYDYDLMSQSQCVRLNLGTKQRGARGTPGWAHRVVLRVHKDLVADDGLCEVDKTPVNVPDGEVLFTQAQIDTICSECTIDPPPICSKSLLQSSLSVRQAESGTSEQGTSKKPLSDVQKAEKACNEATPKIDLKHAEGLCASALDVAACVIDYCSTNGDDAMVEMAIAEKTHFLPGCKTPGGTCSSTDECCDRMICENSVCKYPELETCSQPKSDADECMPHPQGGYRLYATNSDSADKRCDDEFRILNDAIGLKIFETNDLDGCAELCDTTSGCIGFDFKDTKQASREHPPTEVHRCTLCQEVLDICPKLSQSDSSGKVKYYHRTSSGCSQACKNSGDSCSSQQDCCNNMVCDNTVCKESQLVECSHALENEDTCVNGHTYATKSASGSKRCKPDFLIPGPTTDYHETDDLGECATLCDSTEGCVAFDFKNRTQPSAADPSIRKYRCSLCKETEAGCPVLKHGQYDHFHLTYSGCL